MDDEVQKIGIFGMGGVGKTTIMHHINNQLMEMTDKFENVIGVTVSRAFGIVKLQNEIAEAVTLDLSDCKDEMRRASKLFAVLSHMRNYVPILDDLWEAFPLEKVGLPEPTRMNGCKLVLTTRSLKICKKMECSPIKVELLSEQEALDLLMIKVARQSVLPPEVLEIAKLVAKKCACLPLAIVTVAGSMKGWRIFTSGEMPVANDDT
ncbi:Nucleotide-binding site leucine-rich repeat protein [Melia azedarach]|uniref:Nucleotide-binding site leucine-rich repeat protein n=1 Tax=Melia azedarach TaxID=155640 RepID=A0ACC1YCF2_MELAZ|nr:Nucleotide-binding site leucine-rich repeat protein [Melia azedarach]